MRPLGDRRSRARLDVVGTLFGLLEMTEAARIRNVSRTGALIDAPFPVALESMQTVTVTVEGEQVAVDARVRHVRRIDVAAQGSEPGLPRYLIGVEFLSPPESVLQSIDRLGGTVEA